MPPSYAQLVVEYSHIVSGEGDRISTSEVVCGEAVGSQAGDWVALHHGVGVIVVLSLR